MGDYYAKREASIRGFLRRRMKQEAIPLREIVEWAQKRHSITADEVKLIVERALRAQRMSKSLICRAVASPSAPPDRRS
jgi:hypothetical protein